MQWGGGGGGALDLLFATNFLKVFGCATWKMISGCLHAICLVPSIFNINADKSSKEFNEETEWQLHSAIFCKIIDMLGTSDIDLFECRLNHQLAKYVSWKPDPGACHIDAFSFSWSGKFVYIFPPFSLLNRCLQKLENDKALVLLIAPMWPTQVW